MPNRGRLIPFGIRPYLLKDDFHLFAIYIPQEYNLVRVIHPFHPPLVLDKP